MNIVHTSAHAARSQQAWDKLSPIERIHQWTDFTEAVDYGDAGHHPYYALLAPLYAIGASPLDDEENEPADHEAYPFYADAWFDACEVESDTSRPIAWDRFDPAEADVILGIPPF